MGAAERIRQERRDEFRRRLLEATEELLRGGASFTELGVERLAVAAGSSRPTFYVYFKGKTELLAEFAEDVLADVAGALGRLWSDDVERIGPMHMLAATRGVIEAFRRHQLVLAAVAEVAGYTAEIDAAFREQIERNAEYSREFLEREQAAGRVRDIDARLTARTVTWMVERCCAQMLREPAAVADDDLAVSLTEMIWAAIYLEDAGVRHG
ncbi:TetR/AcrR family transcriptional regulator [Mycolicibacterium neoaurum]|uniref:TetR/AcrR family transcriptional regulator n=1 Tax=Mycolicibacterium neoaurum TaxID=1795 RepID=UPI0026727093|nr:TetR/AcrR family transcriptional regulator [Mycolicibacterium neoaurum]MDO3400474.1 TetR/AcrR family transcriptional regulator [Mycolicibacterium neoaurum]